MLPAIGEPVMMRFLSILLILIGMVAAAFGAARLMEIYLPGDSQTAPVMAESAYEPAPEPPGDWPEPAVREMRSALPPPPPPPAAGPELGDSGEFSDAEVSIMFQTQGDDEGAYADEPRLAMTGEPGPALESAAPASASFMDTLRNVPVAHETPASAEYKRAFNVTFAIDGTGGGDAVSALPGRGVIGTGEAQVSDRVEVRLSGASFDITANSPAVQRLSPLTQNTWRWSVIPLSAGDHDLVFEVFAIDQNDTVPLRTFRDRVTVSVSGLNRAIAFADQANPLFVLLGGLGSLIAGGVAAIRFFGKR
jgi:hypothetical protein